ncbi:MAG: VCBS repeat-containing protein [Lentisphaerae bacterium]|nr:VCBS repeat-containing protein [Lentisphaerota bacterium]
MLGLAAAGLLAARAALAQEWVSLTPPALTNDVMYGYNASNHFLVVSNIALSNLRVTVTSSTNWLDAMTESEVHTFFLASPSPSANSYRRIVVTYSNQVLNLPPATHTGYADFAVGYHPIAVDGFITQQVAFLLNVMQLQVAPSSLAMTNGVMYGYAVSNETFSVWNSGGGAFNYTAAPVGDTANWLTLSSYSGLAGSNTITAQFAAGMAPSNYSGTIKVASSDGFGATGYVGISAQVVAPPIITFNPLIVTQAVPLAANPTNQSFTIRNGSAAPVAPMQYSIAASNGSPELIQSLSATGGTSVGAADSVQISYRDLTALPAGIYTAIVQAAGVDVGTTYWPTGTVHVSTTLVVRIEIVAPLTPSGVTASDGTFTSQVAVSWNAVAGAFSYKVYRSATVDWTLAEPIGEELGTTFTDSSAQAGVLYYYWVSALNSYRGEGLLSTAQQTGYRGLAAPAGLFATDGTYTNKVRLTWPLVDGATGYRVYRGIEGGALAEVYFTTAGLYDDLTVTPGARYEYQVAATNGLFGGELSLPETGYAFGPPQGLSASDGSYVNKVQLGWSAVESALNYEVWRSTRAITPPGGGATRITTINSTNHADISATAGTTYYYWVRANSLAAGTGDFSPMDSGYAATAGVDLRVDDLIMLPAQVGVGSAPAIVSLRLENGGGANMSGANGTVLLEFFASTNPTFGAGSEILLGQVADSVTLAEGAATVIRADAAQLTAPTTEGDYYVFARGLPVSPSLLAELNRADNVAARAGAVRVRSSGSLNYQAFNDYDGDGISDLGVYQGGTWSVRAVDERVLAAGVTLFGANSRPVLGDLDGDRKADPMAYESGSGLWQILYSGSGYSSASGVFGGAGYSALTADYEGVGQADASIYHETSGRWYVLRKNGGLVQRNWGGTGYCPVIGDYDGDGQWDLAVYQETTAAWYIQTLAGQLLLSGTVWGGSGFAPVAGDYDGDGRWDLAVYQEATGLWHILSLAGQVLGRNIGWGGQGLEPVMGDYDGDGRWDLAVYDQTTGLWYIRTLAGNVITWDDFWGGPGYRPIGN